MYIHLVGKKDIVRCFCCNLGLAEWAGTDNPWTEHARHNPKCWFLRREKGQRFIDSIQEEWKKVNVGNTKKKKRSKLHFHFRIT